MAIPYAELEEIGLTQREIKVYVALLEIGQSSVGNIVKKSRIASSKIYEILDKLIEKGLVSFVMKNNVKYYTASDPETILKFLEEKKIILAESIIPSLKNMYHFTKAEKQATVYEGIRGLKAVYEIMLKELNKDETLYVLGAPAKANEKLETYFQLFHRRRIANKNTVKIVYNSDAAKYLTSRKAMKLTEVRIMSKDQAVPCWIDIFSDYIALFSISDKDQTAVLIKDKSIAESFRIYFEIIWNSSKKV